jgi:hypothetical protein
MSLLDIQYIAEKMAFCDKCRGKELVTNEVEEDFLGTESTVYLTCKKCDRACEVKITVSHKDY